MTPCYDVRKRGVCDGQARRELILWMLRGRLSEGANFFGICMGASPQTPEVFETKRRDQSGMKLVPSRMTSA